MIEITREQLERHVPALANAEGDVFALIKDKIDEVAAEVELFAEGQEFTDAAVAYICNEGARRAVPQLDLVITASGIGVVSNQNVAPASRERVDALLGSLHRSASAARDLFVGQLAKRADFDTAHRRLSHLLFTTADVRNYGIKPEGREVYLDQYNEMSDALEYAADRVRDVCGDDFYAELIDAARSLPSATSEANAALRSAELLTAAVLINDLRRIEHYRLRLIERLRRLEPESYVGTPQQQANDFENYQNEQQHPSYFSV